MSEEILAFNGLDAETGEYLYQGPAVKGLLKPATEGAVEYYADLTAAGEAREPGFGGPFNLKYERLDKTGWGVIYPKVMKPGVKEAIQTLVDFRKAQLGPKWKDRKIEFIHEDEEPVRDFLSRYGAAESGLMDPEKMPYYLMIVGGPDEISFEFQFGLDVQYGVGRVCFDDSKGYEKYVESVISAENHGVKRDRKVAFFGVANAGDPSTQSSARFLVEPLVRNLLEDEENFKETWEFQVEMREKATREKLGKLLGGSETPALLFSASHGTGGSRRVTDEAARRRQGMLVCQDYPGDAEFRKVPKADQLEAIRRCCFAADDLDEKANVAGTVVMLFACYGAGTPKKNIFFDADQAAVKFKPDRPAPLEMLSEQSFVSSLAKRLLSHPNGGALAVLGQVDRALDLAFQNPGDKKSSHIMCFTEAVKKLLMGYPMGYATEAFGSKHADVGRSLGPRVETLKSMVKPDVDTLLEVFDLHNARAFILVGDPAVKLAV